MFIECMHCQKTLKVPDTAIGKAIRCPACRHVLDVPQTAGPPDTSQRPPEKKQTHAERPNRRPPSTSNVSESEDIEDYDSAEAAMPAPNDLQSFATSLWSELNPFASNTFDPWQNRPDTATRSAANMRLTGVGLLLTAGSLATLLASTLLTMMAPMFVGVPQAAVIVLIGVSSGIASIGWTLGGIGLIGGFILCMFVPKESKAKIHITRCLMLLLAHFASICIHLIADGLLPIHYVIRSPVMYSAQIVGAAILAFQIVFFGKFLKSAANFARLRQLGNRAEQSTTTLCATFLIWMLIHMGFSMASPYVALAQTLSTVFGTLTGIAILVASSAFLAITLRIGVSLRRFY